MDYITYLFLNHLPLVEQEVRFVNGEEQTCLIIPTKINQLKRGRNGNWVMPLLFKERPPNAKLITHEAELIYLSAEEADKARAFGYYDRTMRMGRVRVHDRTPSRKIDRTNRTTDIRCDGVIVLSDIPKSMIFRNGENDRRYIDRLSFRSYSDDVLLYTGSVCIDDIPRGLILTNPDNGKKYINVIFKRMEKLDTYLNTHHLVMVTESGSEIEIGRFKEWRRTDAAPPPRQAPPDMERHDTTVTPRPAPKSIDGIKF